MPDTMKKTPIKVKQLKAELAKELNFIQNIFSVLNIPLQVKGNNENDDYEMTDSTPQNDQVKEMPKRARSIVELEEKLEKIKSQNKFNLKNKLMKKSLSSKLNKKMKKERNKSKPKPMQSSVVNEPDKKEKIPNKVVNTADAKPIFNSDAKLVFSKFDFSNTGQKDKHQKAEKNPKKILENLQHQEEKLKQLENQSRDKVKAIKEKIAWKNLMQKAEGQKVKDDPVLLKKTIKKMEQKKNQSKKKWENRLKGVEQKKQERQKKRRENISKKKKEKKSKVVKAAIARGRVVI